MDPDDEVSYGLVMPFVECSSTGGPFDDIAFAAGWQCGQIHAELAAGHVPGFRAVFTAVLRQLDLLAMHHGYVIEHGVQTDEWTEVLFVRAEGARP